MLHYLNNLLIIVNLFFPGTEMKGNEKAKGQQPLLIAKTHKNSPWSHWPQHTLTYKTWAAGLWIAWVAPLGRDSESLKLRNTVILTWELNNRICQGDGAGCCLDVQLGKQQSTYKMRSDITIHAPLSLTIKQSREYSSQCFYRPSSALKRWGHIWSPRTVWCFGPSDKKSPVKHQSANWLDLANEKATIIWGNNEWWW